MFEEETSDPVLLEGDLVILCCLGLHMSARNIGFVGNFFDCPLARSSPLFEYAFVFFSQCVKANVCVSVKI